MSQGHDLALEGSVVAVAADRGHHFSKPTQERIILVEGHGVEGDAHAGPFVRHRNLARRRPRLPNLRQVHLIADSDEVARVYRYEVARGFRDDVAHLSDLISPGGEAF